MISIRPAGVGDAGTISALARTIWYQHYPGIISESQIEYMLARGYSDESLRQQITARSQSYWLAYEGDEAVGYASWSVKTDGKETWVYLNKLYALAEIRGRGIGATLLNQVIQEGRMRGISSIRLNVNKYNPTVSWYERKGFTVYHEVVLDIGNGYVMDDFVMELRVQ